MVRIENWAVVVDQDPYQAPEAASRHLTGDIYGDKRFPDGHYVRTSEIIEVKGRQVRTRSGTLYQLGNPEEKYAIFCEEIGKPLDQDNPIKVV